MEVHFTLMAQFEYPMLEMLAAVLEPSQCYHWLVAILLFLEN